MLGLSTSEKVDPCYGPWAVVTGASDGIGAAVAAQLASSGINLVLVARGRDRLQTLAGELAAAHSIDTRVIACDLGDGDAVARLEQQTRDLDIGLAVLAAGFGGAGGFTATPLADELDMIAVNIAAVTRLSHTFGGRFVRRGSGALMLFGSLLGGQGVPGQVTYAATKGFVRILAEGLDAELRAQGVDVLCVAPGPVATGFGDRAGLTMTAADRPEVVARAALRTLGRRATVVPGVRGKLLTAALATLPRRWRTRILGRVIAGMRTTQRSRGAADRPDATGATTSLRRSRSSVAGGS